MARLARPVERARSRRAARGDAPPSLARWTALCVAAETVGMTAAAGAAKSSQALIGEPSTGSQIAAALSLVVVGGVIEGLALGVAQSYGLAAWLGRERRLRWIVVTVAIAGLGWAGASAPAVLGGEGGDDPPVLLVLAGAAALGVAMGMVLGGAQAWVLAGRVRHPRRWVIANVAGWAAAMPVIFLGATTPGAEWSVLAVVASGTVTGVAAGAVLGLVTGRFLESLTR